MSLETAVLQVHYLAWQELDVAYMIESLDGDYGCDDLESISVEGFDVLVKTTDGKEHRLEQIIPDLVVETDQPTRLELWNLRGRNTLRFDTNPTKQGMIRVQSVGASLKGAPVLDVSP